MRFGFVVLAFSLLGAGCNSMTVREGVLSTNQRVAVVSTPGDGFSPPTSLVLLENRPGRFVPVATGFAPPPVTSFLAGAGAGIALGVGTYGAARVARPVVSNVVQGGSALATGGSATGGSATGGSAVSY